MAGINNNTKLMLHCNGDNGSQIVIDDSPSLHIVTAHGTAQLDTSEKVFGTASALFDGDSDYFTIPSSSDFNVFGSSSDDWTIDFRIKFVEPDISQGDYLLFHYQNSSNYWGFAYWGTLGFIFVLRVGGSNIINSAPQVSPISDTNWHHVALIKKGNQYGIYIDGIQVDYEQNSSTGTFNGNLFIAQRGDNTNYLNGRMDEIRIQHSNYFNANPNVLLSDTISVPIKEYSISANQKSQSIIIV